VHFIPYDPAICRWISAVDTAKDQLDAAGETFIEPSKRFGACG
jgi:hypothetical protein